MANEDITKKIAHLAAEVLRNPKSSEIEKSLAGSDLTQFKTGYKPSEEMIAKAKEVLAKKDHHAKEAVELAQALLDLSK